MQGDVLIDMLEDRPVAYHPKLAKCVGGVKAAIMLCQLLYWAAGKTAKARDGWFYKSVNDMEEETGLSKEEQQTARDKLDNLGVIESKLKGIPRTWHYRVNRERLRQVIVERLSHWEETTANDGGDLPPILGGVSSQLNKNQETTQETTQDKAAQAPRPIVADRKASTKQAMQRGHMKHVELVATIHGAFHVQPNLRRKDWTQIIDWLSGSFNPDSN